MIAVSSLGIDPSPPKNEDIPAPDKSQGLKIRPAGGSVVRTPLLFDSEDDMPICKTQV